MKYHSPNDKFQPEPDEDDCFQRVEGVLGLLLVLVVLNRGEDAQAQAEEDSHEP